MRVFEVIKQGYFIKDYQTTQSDAHSLLSLLDSVFYDANLALHLYEEAMASFRAHMRTEERREAWHGVPPELFIKMPNMHARSFIYALDTFQKSLKLLAARPSASGELVNCTTDFKQAFPDLIDVRDSAHHAEDRVRGLRFKKEIEMSGSLYIDVLQGRQYTNTLGDGRIGSVEVSASKMEQLQEIFQRILDSFTWIDSTPIVLPSNRSM